MHAYINPFVEHGYSWHWEPKHVPTGSLYIANPFRNRRVVEGDSGGPAFAGNTVYAVASMIYDPYVDVDFVFAGVEKYDEPGTVKKNNNAWLRHWADFICTKKVAVYPKPGVATITGTAVRPNVYQELEANGRINMVSSQTQSDGAENIHEGMSISLSATLEPGYEFVQWEGPDMEGAAKDGTKRNLCPCNGSTNPVCTLTYDNIGYYDEFSSIDEATCSVTARQSGGSGSGSGSGSGGSPGAGQGGTTGPATGGGTGGSGGTM
jgi:uncharacterized membrane protein YgcG